MLTKQEEANMVRTSIDGAVSDPVGTKIRALVTKTKTAHGRYPTAEEMATLSRELGFPCSIAPNLAGRAVGVTSVTKAAPAAPTLPDHYREPEPMTSEERAKVFHARTKELRAEGVESMRAAKLAFRYAYGDQVPACDLVDRTPAPPTMTAADEADRDRRFRALIKEKKDAGIHPNTARSEAFTAIYGDLYAK